MQEGNHKSKQSQMNKVPKIQLTLTLERTREREREKKGDGTLVHGEGAGEEGRPMKELRRPELRRLTAAAAASRGGARARKIGVGG
jgi:hypothetical protein